MSRLALVLVLVVACGGDDGVNNLPDAPLPPGVTLTVAPATIVIASGATVTVMATIERGGDFTGEVVVSAMSPSADLAITGGTIAAGETSVALTVSAAANVQSAMVDVSVDGEASVAIDPAPLAVTIAGQAGPAIGGGAAGEQAGTASALSADGSRLIVGGPLSDAGGNESGIARVFDRSGGAWVQVGGDLVGEAAGDRFGGDVAISNDGTRIAVGSYLNDGNGAGSGHVRVFDLVGGAWTQVGADIDGLGSGDGHGWAVALDADGSRVVVGAPVQNGTNGTAHVWEWSGTAWVALGAPVAGNRERGHAVDISDDGNRIVVSAPSAEGAQYPGDVGVYEWDGVAWMPLGALILGAQPSATNGDSVALSADGNTLAIGSSGSDLGATNTGAARVFRWSAGDGAWVQVGGDLPGPTGSTLGTSIAISADGTRVLAGGPSGGGFARLFVFANDAWTESMASFGGGSRTGHAVALSADGRTGAVGAPYANTGGSASGEVRVYDLP
ncbi:MAG: WD40 repeat domain-containing protein [Kofleriaceae bacterium]